MLHRKVRWKEKSGGWARWVDEGWKGDYKQPRASLDEGTPGVQARDRRKPSREFLSREQLIYCSYRDDNWSRIVCIKSIKKKKNKKEKQKNHQDFFISIRTIRDETWY